MTNTGYRGIMVKGWLIGMMADRYLRYQYIGLMTDKLDSERQRGFFDRWTDVQTDICNCRVTFAFVKIHTMIDKES